MNGLRYLSNCFWLFVPILLFNLLFARHLPPAYDMEVFWKDIPPSIRIPEHILRVAVILIPAFMPLKLFSTRQKAGLALYILGVLVYFTSWIVPIYWPAGAWSSSAAGFLAPAYTPILWLMGIALIVDKPFTPAAWYKPWMYAILAGAFLVFHNFHAVIVYMRNH